MLVFGILVVGVAIAIALAAGLQERPLRPDEVSAVKEW
jgi:hypothetical protein